MNQESSNHQTDLEAVLAYRKQLQELEAAHNQAASDALVELKENDTIAGMLRAGLKIEQVEQTLRDRASN